MGRKSDAGKCMEILTDSWYISHIDTYQFLHRYEGQVKNIPLCL